MYIKPTQLVGQTEASSSVGLRGRIQAYTQTANTSDNISGKVVLSDTSSQMRAMESQLQRVDVVNQNRVKEIKDAIAQGRFQIHEDVIADRLIDTVKDYVLTTRP